MKFPAFGRSLRARLLMGAAAWIALALLAAGLLIHELLRDHVTRTADARLEASMLGLMAAVEFDGQGRLVKVRDVGEPAFDRSASGWYWQIRDASGVLLQSRSLQGERLPRAPLLAQGAPRAAWLQGLSNERLYGRQRGFTAPGDSRALDILVAAPEALVREELDRLHAPLVVALLLLGAGLLLAVALQVQVGLSPLRAVRADIRRVREGEADRLSAVSLTEIEPLTAEINQLITHNQAVMARARAHVGNLAHALKTPLSALLNTLRMDESAAARAMLADAERIQRLIHHHLQRARHAASTGALGQRSRVAPVVEDLFALMRKAHADRGLRYTHDLDPRRWLPLDPHDLEELLGNLIDNAAKWARSNVWVTLARGDDSTWRLSVSDDGPGLPEAERLRLLQRGERLDESTPGHGLGLSIVQELIGLRGGVLELSESEAGGLCVTLQIPRR